VDKQDCSAVWRLDSWWLNLMYGLINGLIRQYTHSDFYIFLLPTSKRIAKMRCSSSFVKFCLLGYNTV
jgi:hypothetical protein